MIEQNPWVSRKLVAEQFGVARSTLYLKQKQIHKDKKYLEEILSAMKENPYYGQRRLALAIGRNVKLVRRIMRKYGLRPKKKKRKFNKPEDENKPPSGIPNRLKTICPIRPLVVYAGDFTHFVWYGTLVYLATVLDLYTREIVGWSIGLHHSGPLITNALEDAKKRRGAPYLFHSDQGSEYTSLACKEWLFKNNILPSQSTKSSPWQNGWQESFYGRFKQEFGNIHRFKTLEDFIEAIHLQIHYYNTKRIHSKLKMPPEKFFLLQIKKWI